MKKSVSAVFALFLCITAAAAYPLMNLPTSTIGQLAGFLFAPQITQTSVAPEPRSVMTVGYSTPGGVYTQNFDSLATSGTNNVWTNDSTIDGWYLFRQPAPGTAITAYNAEAGTGTAGSFISYGTGTTTERAFGGLGSGGTYFGSPAAGSVAGWIAIGTLNSTGITLDTATITFDGEQWRNNNNATAQTMVLEYGFGATFDAVTTWTAPGGNFDWSSPINTTTAAAVDGNVAGKVSGRGGTLTSLGWVNGTVLWIRWVERNDTGNDHGLAIDNFTLTANGTPTYCSTVGDVAITDDGYNGTLGSMVSKTISVPASGNVTSIRVSKVAASHTWVGDLTFKLQSPTGTVLTLLNRPGVAVADNGTDSVGSNFGDNSVLSTLFPISFDDSAATDAELMGSTIDFQTVCQNDGICSFNPGPDTATTPPSTLSAFVGQPANGTWTLYAGDSVFTDVGVLNEVCLQIQTDGNPEMDVRGGSPLVSITDGDSTPSLTDHTDFGQVNANGLASVTRQFWIDNTGNADLNIPGTPKVLIGGVDAGEFVLTTDAQASVEPGGSIFFEVRFDPSTPGLKNATISIANNDTDENPYNFSIQGTGVNSSLQFTSATYSAAENAGGGNLVMQVERTGSTVGAVGATVTFTDGTANGDGIANLCGIGVDYVDDPKLVSFADGEGGTKNVFIPLCNEADIEPDETFTGTLGSPTGGAVIGSQGSATNTITTDDVGAPEINVQGNSVDIASGDTTPDLADHTAFGSIAVGGGSLSRTFTIQNLGSAALNLTNNPRITISGPHPGNFGLTTDATTPVAAGGSTTFTLSCTPSSLNDFFAIVVIQNDDPTGSEGSSGGYNFTVKCTGINARYRSAATGNWNALSTWEQSNDGGSTWVAATSTPISTNSDSIVIRNGHTVTITSTITIDQTTIDSGGAVIAASSFNVTGNSAPDLTNNGTLTVNSGSQLNTEANIQNNSTININGIVQLNSGGSLNGATYVYGPSSILSFNRAFTVGSADDGFWPSTNGPASVSVVGFGTVTLNVPRTVTGTVTLFNGLTNAGNLTVNGMLDIWTGGFVTGSPTYGPASTLRYFSGGTYGRAGEWLPNATSGAGYPNNVTIVGNTTLDLPNSSTAQPFQMAGDLLVDTGSKLQMAGATPMTAPLRVLGDVTNSGEIELSTQANGDLFVGGNWDDNGTLTHNTRIVTFDGTGAQAINGNTDFGHLVIQTTTARTITFGANSVQAVFNSLTLTGTAGNLLTLRSSSPGTKWGLGAPLTQNVAFVDVQDSDADFGQTVNANNSVNSGNNDNWNFGAPAAPVMTTSPGSLLFGNVNVGATSATQQFTVTNNGTASLTFSAVLGGTDSASFILAVDNSTPIGTGANRQGTVQCAPTSTGAKSATLTISGNDPANPSDVITLSCTGVAPEMSIENSNQEVILDGDITPTVPEETDFGSTATSGGTVVRTFTIKNTGTANLNLTGTPRVAVSGTHASDFTVTAIPSSPIAPAGSTTFQVTFDPSADGLRSAAISIANDDADENPYNFLIQGSGTATLPSVTTNAASAVTSVSATLNGQANPNGAATTGWFRYDTVNPGTCNDVFGTRAPVSGGDALGSGISPVSFNEPISGLSPATTYFFCAIAQNSAGTSFGTVLQFTTTAAAPTVTTNAASSVASTTATLNGLANPNGASATGYFRYSTTDPVTCNDSFGTRAPGSGGTALGSGTSGVSFNQAISGLTPTTTYYFCAIASNSVGTSFGSVLSFTTPAAAPSTVTNAATSVAATSATLNGAANPNGSATTGWFRYSTVNPGTCNDVFGTRAPASGGDSVGSGTSPVSFDEPISGLTPATTYFFCAIAQNSVGTSFGAVLQFTTSGLPPSVTSNAATSISSTGATLNGDANPNGGSTTGYFRYSTTDPVTCNDSFGTRAPGSGGTVLGSGNSPVTFNQPIAGLVPGTTYYFCAIASNSVGTGFGAVLSFTTGAGVPSVVTNAATLVTSTSAQLNGSANPNAGAATGWFRYSTVNPGTCNDVFGTRAPSVGGSSLGSGNSPVAFSEAISGLSSSTTYYYCAIAQNSAGTGLGAVLSFTTSASGGASIVVDSLSDNTNVDGQCTLREAIIAANTNTGGDCAAGTGNDTITFDPALFPFASVEPEGVLPAIVLGGTELVLSSDMTIDGPGADKLVISGNNASRVFRVDNATVEINDLLVTGGNGVGFHTGLGGGIRSIGSLTLDRMFVTGNSSAAIGGGVSVATGASVIRNSTISGNTAGDGGGVYHQTTLTIVNSTISGNAASGQCGGTSSSSNSLILRNSTITQNQGGSFGGGICTLNLDIGSSIVSGNTAADLPEIQVRNIGSAVSAGFNMVGNSTGDAGDTELPIPYQPSDILDVNPMLGLLANNGGTTPTHLPVAGFPGHDKGCAFGLTTDQRGQQRTVDWPNIANGTCTGSETFGGVTIGTDIGAVEVLIPTAANATVSGRVVGANGRGLANVRVSAIDLDGNMVNFGRTNSFGYFTIYEVPSGADYVIEVASKRYTFPKPTMLISVVDNVEGVIFVAGPN